MRNALLFTGVGFVALAVALVATGPAAAADGVVGSAPEAEAIGAGVDRLGQPVALITAMSRLPNRLSTDSPGANLYFRQVRSQTLVARNLQGGQTAAALVPIGRGAITGNLVGLRGQLRGAQLTAAKNQSYCVFVIPTRGGATIKVVGEGRAIGNLIYAQPDQRCAKKLHAFDRFRIWR